MDRKYHELNKWPMTTYCGSFIVANNSNNMLLFSRDNSMFLDN